MWVRLRTDDIRLVAHFVGRFIIGIGLAMVAPMATGFIAGEPHAAIHYVFGMGVALLIGAALINIDIHAGRVSHTHAFAITALGWLGAAAVGAVPLALSGNYSSYLDALFDAISGLTVSGLTLAADLDHMAHAHNMWRHLMQFIGGQGIVVAALSLAVGLRGGAFSLYFAEGRDERILPNVLHTARFIWFVTAVYVVFGTVTLFGVMSHLGMSPGRGVLHAFWISVAAFDTGGFAPQRMNLMYYHSYLVELIALFLMAAGSLNFALHARVWAGAPGELWKSIETRVLAGAIAVMSMLVVLGAKAEGAFTGTFGIFRRSVFQVISGHSAGHQTVYGNQLLHDFGGAALIAIIIGMGIGGSLSSTGGGIKALRLGVIGKSIVLYIKQALAPNSATIRARYHHLGPRVLTPEVTGMATTMFVLYIATYVTGAVIGAAYGYSMPEALFESVSATANSGLSIGVTSPSMPTGLKLTYMFQMWAGRLEFVAVLVLVANVLLAMRVKKVRV